MMDSTGKTGAATKAVAATSAGTRWRGQSQRGATKSVAIPA